MSMRVGLVLSGAGARMTAHLGVIKALEEQGVKISAVSGTSAGAIVGAFYCAGMPVDDIYNLATRSSYKNLVSFAGFGGPPFSMEKGIGYIRNLLPVRTFEELDIPLHVCVTDIKRGVPVMLQSGDLAQAVIASSAIAPLMRPIRIGTTLYADGGIMDNLPLEILSDKTDRLVGVNANPLVEFDQTGFFSYFRRVLFLLFYANISCRKEAVDLYIEPCGIEKFSIFDTTKYRECYALGYAQTMRCDVKTLLQYA